MGQVLGPLQDKFKVSITQEHIRKITDGIYDKMKQDGEDLTRERLHEAVTNAFKKMNEVTKTRLPIPSKDEVQTLIVEIDKDEDNVISKDEFATFVLRLSGHVINKYLKNVVIVTVVVPLAAMATKKATQRIPVVGGLAKNVPYSFFLAATTSAALIIQQKLSKQGSTSSTSASASTSRAQAEN